jgi:hypothetical protein
MSRRPKARPAETTPPNGFDFLEWVISFPRRSSLAASVFHLPDKIEWNRSSSLFVHYLLGREASPAVAHVDGGGKVRRRAGRVAE